jgi:hypothetical protein
LSNLVSELLLRLIKPLAAALLGLILFVILTGVLGAPGSASLALLCFLSGAALILLVQESPL